jgi:hypothetical protein
VTLGYPFMPRSTALNVRARLEFKKRDCWIGAYWDDDPDYMPLSGNLWICLLPMLPLHIWWWATDPEGLL